MPCNSHVERERRDVEWIVPRIVIVRRPSGRRRADGADRVQRAAEAGRLGRPGPGADAARAGRLGGRAFDAVVEMRRVGRVRPAGLQRARERPHDDRDHNERRGCHARSSRTRGKRSRPTAPRARRPRTTTAASTRRRVPSDQRVAASVPVPSECTSAIGQQT